MQQALDGDGSGAGVGGGAEQMPGDFGSSGEDGYVRPISEPDGPYRSHYRVCTMFVPAEPPPREPWDEYFYSPPSLKELVAVFIKKSKIPTKNLPADLDALISIEHKKVMDVKSRSCPECTTLRIGGFADAPPDALNRHCPSLFSVDLLGPAASVLRGLDAADQHPLLDNYNTLVNTICDRYPFFLKLQASTNDVLLPPIDVAQVWFTHMLQSQEYASFCKRFEAPQLATMPHVWTRCLSPVALRRAEALCRRLWAAVPDRLDPCATWDVPEKPLQRGKKEPNAHNYLHWPHVSTVNSDRQWVRELKRSTSLKIPDLLCESTQFRFSEHLHPLSRGLTPEPWTCLRCERKPESRFQRVWHCSTAGCTFVICDACLAHPKHRLVRITPGTSVEEYEKYDKSLFTILLPKPKPVKPAPWNCSICNFEGTGETYCCLACNYVLCETCTRGGPLPPLAAAPAVPVTPPMLARGIVGYQRFLYLLAKYERTMEKTEFAPCPMIDLFWHTHLAMPGAYYVDSVRLMGSVRHHKLLSFSQQTVQSYNPKKNLEEAMWNAEFGGESMGIYATKPDNLPVQIPPRCGKREPNDYTSWVSTVSGLGDNKPMNPKDFEQFTYQPLTL